MKTKEKLRITLERGEVAVCLRTFRGVSIEHYNVQHVQFLPGGALQFRSENGTLITVGPAVRWEVFDCRLAR